MNDYIKFLEDEKAVFEGNLTIAQNNYDSIDAQINAATDSFNATKSYYQSIIDSNNAKISTVDALITKLQSETNS